MLRSAVWNPLVVYRLLLLQLCFFVKRKKERGETETERVGGRVPDAPHEIKLEHGSRAITSLALDPSGARVISGAVDYELKFWDFAG